MITTFSNFLKQDVMRLMKHHRKQLVGISFIIGFILFLLNLFLGASFYMGSFGETLKDRLGMYFYIKDDTSTQSITYKKMIALQNDLAKEGIKTSFSSKDDAMNFLQKKIPDVMENFDKFGVDNPLPSTLYVMFRSQSQYDTVKEILVNYKDIILNDTNLKSQETRTLGLINLANFVEGLLIGVVVVLVGVICAIIAMMTMVFAKHFKKQLEIRNLLGALAKETANEFSLIHLELLVIGFVVCGLALLFLWIILGVSLNQALSVSFGTFVMQPTALMILLAFVVEIILFFGFAYGFSYYYISHHQKKIA